MTNLPVIGVPVPLRYLDGLDSLLSIVQMPAGIPVATVAIGGAKNAALLAARILALHDADLAARLVEDRALRAQMASDQDASLLGDVHEGAPGTTPGATSTDHSHANPGETP